MKGKFKPGQSLMEVVVAMGLVVVAVVALVSTTIFTQKAARSANAQTQATKLAEESIEQLRVIRDRRGFGYLVASTCYILNATDPDPNSWSLTICGTPPSFTLGNIEFVRSIDVVDDGANKKKVTVSVSWQESGGTKKVENVTFFSNF